MVVADANGLGSAEGPLVVVADLQHSDPDPASGPSGDHSGPKAAAAAKGGQPRGAAAPTVGGRQKLDSAPAVLLEVLGDWREAAYTNGTENGPHRPFPMEEEREVAVPETNALAMVAEGNEEEEQDGYATLERHLRLLGQLGVSTEGVSVGDGDVAAVVAARRSVDNLGLGEAALLSQDRSSRSFDGNSRPPVPRLQLASIPDEVC